MTTSHQINPRQALVFDALEGTSNTTRGVLMTIEGQGDGPVLNCAVIPERQLGAVIVTLQLIQKQLTGAA